MGAECGAIFWPLISGSDMFECRCGIIAAKKIAVKTLSWPEEAGRGLVSRLVKWQLRAEIRGRDFDVNRQLIATEMAIELESCVHPQGGNSTPGKFNEPNGR